MPRAWILDSIKRKHSSREVIAERRFTVLTQSREEKRGEEIIQLATVGKRFYGQPHRVDPSPPPPCCSGQASALPPMQGEGGG
jgi:hypothetical protein